LKKKKKKTKSENYALFFSKNTKTTTKTIENKHI